LAELLVQIDRGEMTVDIARKKIKNLYIRVDRNDGRVRISAPRWMNDQDLQTAVRKHQRWIQRRQQVIAQVPIREIARLRSGDSVPLFGESHRLEVVEGVARQSARLEPSGLLMLYMRTGAEETDRRAILDHWYRVQIRERIPALIDAWEQVIGVTVAEWGVRRMRTRWGSCNIQARRIWLNLELARRPPECLEYVVVHEMVHLLERGHNRRFYSLVDQFLPGWRVTAKILAGVGPT
jgi:predicted metal-dependent hydrolase